MSAGPRRSLQRERSKFGLNMAALSCLALGIVLCLALILFGLSPLVSFAIGAGTTAATGLTFGRGPEKIFKALYRPRKIYRGFLSNEHFKN
jgi:hypothetical protein